MGGYNRVCRCSDRNGVMATQLPLHLNVVLPHLADFELR